MIAIKNEVNNDEKKTRTYELSFDKETISKLQEIVEKKLAEDVEIKGFRKGKAPLEEARKHLSPERVLNQTIDRLSNAGYDFLLDMYFDKNGVEKDPENLKFFIQQPSVSLKEFKGDEAIIAYTFDLIPDVSVNLDDVKVNLEKPEVTSEQIQARINKELENNSTLETVEDENAALQKGEVAVFDFEGFVDNKPFEGGSAKSYELEIGSGQFIPGFEDQMIGMKMQDFREIKVKFPEDYQAKNLAGKDAVFKVTLLGIKKMVKPEYNDEFIKSLGFKDVTNDEQLRAFFKKRIADENELDYKNQVYKAISEELIRVTKYSHLPQFLIDEQFNRMNQELDDMLKQYKIERNDYLKMMNMSAEELKDRFMEESKKRIILDLAISELAKQKEWIPSTEEVDAEMQKLEDMYNKDKKPEVSAKIKQNKPLVQASLVQQKVFDKLFERISAEQK